MSTWHFGCQFDLAQGSAALQSQSHIEASVGSNKLQMQPFSTVAYVLGLVGSLESTLQVFADLDLDVFWSEYKRTSKVLKVDRGKLSTMC